MTPSDRKRIERVADLAGKLADAIGDAELRGLIGEWKGSTGHLLKDDLNEFHDWQLRRLAEGADG